MDEVKLSKLDGAKMLVFAITIDVVQVLLTFLLIGFVVNAFITFFTILTFIVWLKAKGLGGNIGLWLAAAGFGELAGEIVIPGMDMLPFWTGFALRVIIKHTEVSGMPMGEVISQAQQAVNTASSVLKK